MPKLYFSGVVLPERATLNVSDLRSRIAGSDGSVYADLILNIWRNQITVLVDSEEPNVFTLRNLVRSEVEFVTSLAGFLMGYGYDVEITKAFEEGLGFTRVFGVEVPALESRAKGRDFNALVNSILPLCFGPEAIFLRRCLIDLSFAMKRPDDTGFYCYRALESLRQSFGHDLPDAEQWTAMAKAVGSSKESMEPLRTHAFPARHGIPRPLDDETRQGLFSFTWGIVESYIDHKLTTSGAAPVFRKAAQSSDSPGL
jgi:hypothetical protein